jgi:outer membrane protein TolC
MNLAVPQTGNQRRPPRASLVARVLVFLPLVLAAGCARFRAHPPSLASTTATNSIARSLNDLGLKVFVEDRLNRRFESWPAKVWDFPALTLAAWYFNPNRDLARIPSRDQRVAQAPVVTESAWLRTETAAWQVRASVRTNLLAYVATLRSEALLQDLEATQMELVQVEERRQEADLISYLQLSLLRLKLATTRLALIMTLQQKMAERARLADALGLPVRALFDVEVTFDFDRIVNTTLQLPDAGRQALQSRAEILSALSDYAAAEATLRVEIERKNPSIWFPPGYGWDREKNRWAVNLQLELPGGLRGQGRITKAEARRNAAAAHLLASQTEVIDQVEASVAAYSAALDQMTSVERLVTALREQDDLVTSEWKEGTAERREVLLTRLQVEAAEVLHLDAQVKLQEALGSMEDAAQRPAELMTGF